MLMLFGMAPLLAQSDCIDAITVCGNAAYSGLNATGPGIVNDFPMNSNDCGSFETNSLWLKLPVHTGGTLGFTLTPTDADINIDFDFIVFGPNATCGNLGSAIRCSTTNPAASGATNNRTGMNETETDISEGPGVQGSSFVQWLTVNAGEVYYLVIDRPIGASDFTIEWTGSATFNDAPVFNNPQGISLDIAQCDDDATDDQISTFDIAAHRQMLIGNQANVTLTYHESINDAIVGINAIANETAYNNTSNPQTLYMRLEKTDTECFITLDFDITVTNPVVAGEPLDLSLCDSEETGKRIFNLAQNDALIRDGNATASVTYYNSLANAQQEFGALPAQYESGNATIYARLENTQGCHGFDIVEFTLTVLPLPDIVYTLQIKDFTPSDNSITIVMPDPENYEFSLNGGVFSDNTVFNGLLPGPYTISIRAKTGCKTVSEDIVILNYPRFFTPNGDGDNDVWRIPYLNFQPNATVTVYDRYGKVITGFNGSGGWDGTLNSHKLPATDYWFVLQMDTGRIIKGHFAMVR